MITKGQDKKGLVRLLHNVCSKSQCWGWGKRLYSGRCSRNTFRVSRLDSSKQRKTCCARLRSPGIFSLEEWAVLRKSKRCVCSHETRVLPVQRKGPTDLADNLILSLKGTVVQKLCASTWRSTSDFSQVTWKKIWAPRSWQGCVGEEPTCIPRGPTGAGWVRKFFRGPRCWFLPLQYVVYDEVRTGP